MVCHPFFAPKPHLHFPHHSPTTNPQDSSWFRLSQKITIIFEKGGRNGGGGFLFLQKLQVSVTVYAQWSAQWSTQAPPHSCRSSANQFITSVHDLCSCALLTPCRAGHMAATHKRKCATHPTHESTSPIQFIDYPFSIKLPASQSSWEDVTKNNSRHYNSLSFEAPFMFNVVSRLDGFVYFDEFNINTRNTSVYFEVTSHPYHRSFT